MSVTIQRAAKTNEIVSNQFMQVGQEFGVVANPVAIFFDNLIAGAVTTDDERIAHFEPRPM